MVTRDFVAIMMAGLWSIPVVAQTADFGVDVPVTLSGGTFYSQRLQLKDPNAFPWAAGVQGMLYPTVKLGQHWFGYAAIQIRSNPYVYYDAFSPQHDVETDVLQAYVGYSIGGKRASMVVKAGRLVSAFGAFPLLYDDARNPLLDQPLSYITTLTLRADQLPCGTSDLLGQRPGAVSFHCGGELGPGSNFVPATLYGLPGIEADVSAGRFDARVQLTNESPLYWEDFRNTGEYLQWAAGGGYTISQGFRVGISAYRGPYLDQDLTPLLPTGTSVRDFPASAVGADVKWARGRWSTSGELQRFRFDSPNFVVSPSILSGYVEGKSVITPRFYAAGRAAWLHPESVLDNTGVYAAHYAGRLQSYEAATGFWITRNQLLKFSYEWLKPENTTGTRFNIFGFQYVIKLDPLVMAFR